MWHFKRIAWIFPALTLREPQDQSLQLHTFACVESLHVPIYNQYNLCWVCFSAIENISFLQIYYFLSLKHTGNNLFLPSPALPLVHNKLQDGGYVQWQLEDLDKAQQFPCPHAGLGWRLLWIMLYLDFSLRMNVQNRRGRKTAWKFNLIFFLSHCISQIEQENYLRISSKQQQEHYCRMLEIRKILVFTASDSQTLLTHSHLV